MPVKPFFMAWGGKIRFWRGFFRKGRCGQAGHPVRRGPVRLHWGEVDRAVRRPGLLRAQGIRLRSCGGGRQDALPPLIKRAGEGSLRGTPSRASSDRMAARRAVPVGDAGALRASTAEMRPDGGPQGRARWRRRSPTGIDSRDATGWRPAEPCPLATQEPYGHRQQRCDRRPAGCCRWRRRSPTGIDSRDEGFPPQKSPKSRQQRPFRRREAVGQLAVGGGHGQALQLSALQPAAGRGRREHGGSGGRGVSSVTSSRAKQCRRTR